MGRRETFWGGRRGLESSKILVGLLSLLITIKGVYTTQGGKEGQPHQSLVRTTFS